MGDAQRYRFLKRLKKLERLGLAQEPETGRWSISPQIESRLRVLGERGDIIKTMHRTLAERGIARGMDRYVIHHGPEQENVAIGRVIGKGLSADEMSERIHVVVDGLDGRVHYAEMPEALGEGVKVGSVVEVGRAVARTRESDRNIAEIARMGGGIYEPAIHLSIVNDMDQVPGGDAADYVRAHVRRLEALRRGGIVERIDAQTWDSRRFPR